MKWYRTDEENPIALATKVQLARNLDRYPFSCKLTGDEKAELSKSIFSALSTDNELSFITMGTLSNYEIVSLAEKWLISPEFASSSLGRSLLLSEDEDVSIMLFEEDHVKLQVILPGLNPNSAYEKANVYDVRLENAFQIAFDPKLGYLTQMPANIGTALRASVMLHLYALNSEGEIHRLASTVSKLGLTLRPAYTERRQTIGDIFILSNQVTLGINEKTAINNLELIASQIITQETELRRKIVNEPKTVDNIYRAFGVLSNAYLLTASEFLNLLSLVRFGASEGKLEIDLGLLTQLFIEMQSATLSSSVNDQITVLEREMLRAKRVKEALCK